MTGAAVVSRPRIAKLIVIGPPNGVFARIIRTEMDPMNHFLEVDRLRRVGLVDPGRIVTEHALQRVVAVRAVEIERVMADVAFGAGYDLPPRYHGRVGHTERQHYVVARISHFPFLQRSRQQDFVLVTFNSHSPAQFRILRKRSLELIGVPSVRSPPRPPEHLR